MPIDSRYGQLSPQPFALGQSCRCVSLISLKTEQRELDTLPAQFLQVGNDLALTQRVEHSIVRNIQDSFAFDRQDYLTLLSPVLIHWFRSPRLVRMWFLMRFASPRFRIAANQPENVA